MQRLSCYNVLPPNGLCLFCGFVTDGNGKEKKILIDFEPPKALKSSLYLCDRKFHVESIQSMIETNEKFGFIIISGDECLLAVVAGSHISICDSFKVDLPKHHKNGGQSALRFQRNREISRHDYLSRVGESARRCFLNDGVAHVSGIIIAGSAELKSEFSKSEFLGPNLQAIVITVIDIAYGGNAGLNEAIKKSRNMLRNLELIREQESLEKLFDIIGKDGNYALGPEEVMEAWECKAIDTLYISTELDLVRRVSKDGTIIISKPDSQINEDVHEEILLIDWIIENHRTIGCKLLLISNQSPESAQFYKGLNGICAILRYKMIFEKSENQDESDSEEQFDSDFDDFI